MSEGVVAVDENRMLLFNNSIAQRLGGDIPLDEDIDKWAEKYGVFQPMERRSSQRIKVR